MTLKLEENKDANCRCGLLHNSSEVGAHGPRRQAEAYRTFVEHFHGRLPAEHSLPTLVDGNIRVIRWNMTTPTDYPVHPISLVAVLSYL